MRAIFLCPNGHYFSQRVIEYSPDINYWEGDGESCEECGATDEESKFVEMEPDDLD